MSDPFFSYRKTAWIILLFTLFFVELSLQIASFYHSLSISTWFVIQGLILFWLIFTSYKIYSNSAEQDRFLPDRSSLSDQTVPETIDTEQLIGSVIHEIRSPLNRLQLRIQDEESRSPAKLRADVSTLSQLVNDIEDVFQSSSRQKRWISIPRLIHNFVEQVDASDSIKFIVGSDWLYCQPDHLILVLDNLIRNSCEAAGSMNEANIQITFERIGPEWTIVVSDESGGIDSDRARFINRKTSKESSRSGMGLGLMICKKVLKNHRGRMMIESEPGTGTTVTLTIPEPQPEADPGTQP